ncbi:MAG: RagB/SusD family nutrient uptake outer membrane protein [Cyclobacteriaceae bacterium]|nr:RagB/SusD family nutrient uptake outer membrane protein [Cyclobacteriaceae bacterium]UYN85734.1 MAG: RagB/SusD family nutrient uptake outer membrane protein [Cyclobacteriaceae bacterium]
MKKHNLYILVMVTLLIISPGCNDLLNENPKTTFTTDYFKTAQGYQDGLNAAYSYLRFQYGSNPALGLNITGTDEFTFGPEPNYNPSGDNQPHKLLGTYDVTPQAGYLGITFNRTFPVINTLNGLVAFASQVPTFTELQRNESLAQARYLRAHYYYLLVGQFGAVPLDLGSGELALNTLPFLGFNRGSAEDREQLLAKNYQVMIEDLTFATLNLPDKRNSNEFRLHKAVAFHLLAKVYLARSYSTIAQTNDAQNAYLAANEVITNLGKYGVALQTDFAEVFRQGNDYNNEILFAAERIPQEYVNNGYLNANADGIGDGENMASNCFTCNYEQPVLQTPAGLDIIDGRPFAFQRPLRKLAPTRWLTNVAFADKTNDSRYHNSFRTLWTAATQNASGSTAYNNFITMLTNNGFALGDTAFYLADTPAQAAAMGVSGTNPFGTKYYRVYSSDNWYSNQLYPGPPAPSNTILVYPSLKKFVDVQRASPNGSSGRPMPIFRLAETYLIAAEAAFKTGNTTEAANLINVIRRRAAYRPGLSPAELNTRRTNMEITAGDVTLDFILDERARELAGEGMRWTDLALRGTDVFINRVNLNQDANGKVQPKHRLRPIPQSQLDAINDTDKQKYQNPGY